MSQNDKTEPMNLLFIFSDHHSREKMGCYGNPHIHTPNLDALAENGTRFSSAYCTNPICVPSRASMNIGDYCFNGYSYWDNAHPYIGKEEGWGHRLVQQGYQVTTIGKLHFKEDSPLTGFPDQRIPLHVRDGIGDITHTIRDGTFNRSFLRDAMLNANEGDSEYLAYDAKIGDMAVDFLKNEAPNKSEKPWCLFLGFVCPHFPLIAPKEILDMYRPFEKLPFPKQWGLDERPMHEVLERLREEFAFNDPAITEDDVRRAVAVYYSMVTYMDMQVGRVLQALKEAGLSGNTRIIYTTDHGDTVGDHGLFFKHTMYEGAVGVPLVISGPDIPKGKVVDKAVSLIDIFPTVLECMGAKPKPEDEKLPGISLLRYLRDENIEDRPILADYHAIGIEYATFMLRYKDYKLIYYVNSYPQLFCLANDPDELNDLAANPDYSDVLADMEKRLREICDPEAVDERAKREQAETLESHGGKEAVSKHKVLVYSPTPEFNGTKTSSCVKK